MKYVIIGNSIAAAGCIEGIRSTDKEGSITVIGDEKHHVYSRPLISYLLCGKTDEQKMKYRGDDFYKDNNVTLITGKKAVQADTKSKKVILDDKSSVPYDRLMFACGSRPFVPPMSGLEKVTAKTSFMTLDDAHALDSMIGRKSNVLIIGAGLIGLKCAEGIADKAGHITVVDLAPRVLPNVLDEHAASMVKDYLKEQKDIDVILGDCADKFSENEVLLKSGKKLTFDVLVLAVGVRPNTEIFKDMGGEVSKGIIIDECCATSIDGVFAGGDCCEGTDVSTGTRRIMAILPNAYMQGRTAGINMAGGNDICRPMIPENAAGFFGMHIITAGSYDGDGTVIEDAPGIYKKLFTKDDRLIGYILVGDVQRAGIYTEMIRSGTPLSEVDFELVSKKPQMLAFSRPRRDEIFRRG